MPQEAACDWSSPAGGATLARGEHSQNGVHRHTLGENNLVGFTPKNGIQHGVILGKPVIDSQITNETIRKCFTELAAEIQTDGLEGAPGHGQLSRPLQRKLYSLVTCQLCGGRDGRARAQRAARSMGERAVTELILLHQDPHQLSSNLWAAVRARGCQFLGPAMQDEALKLILLALEDGSSLSRKVLVHFVVQNLAAQHPVVSKTSVGHVVQLMYRASCFVVMKRSEESSLMQLKEELRTFPALRRQHDSQLVKIASEAGLRISPEQWSSLLYGDAAHKSHMQSIIDKLQTHDWFSQGVTELTLTLQRSGDTEHLLTLQPDLLYLSELPAEAETVTEAELETAVLAVHRIVRTLTTITRVVRTRRQETTSLKNPKYKTTLCRDVMKKGACPRGSACAFAHSNEELEIYCQLARRPQHHLPSSLYVPQVSSASLSLADTAALQRVHAAARGRGEGLGGPGGRDANSLLQQQALQQALYPHSDSSSVQDTGHERTALTHIVFSQLASSPLSATRGASPLSATTLQQRGTSPPNGLKQRPYAAQLHVGYYNPTTLAARQATLGLSDSDRKRRHVSIASQSENGEEGSLTSALLPPTHFATPRVKRFEGQPIYKSQSVPVIASNPGLCSNPAGQQWLFSNQSEPWSMAGSGGLGLSNSLPVSPTTWLLPPQPSLVDIQLAASLAQWAVTLPGGGAAPTLPTTLPSQPAPPRDMQQCGTDAFSMAMGARLERAGETTRFCMF